MGDVVRVGDVENKMEWEMENALGELFVAVYGNALRRRMVKEKLAAYVDTIEVDETSKMKAVRPLEKLNRNQRRLLFDLFRVKREHREPKSKGKKHKREK